MKKLNILLVLLTAAVLVSGCSKSRTDSDYIATAPPADGSAADSVMTAVIVADENGDALAVTEPATTNIIVSKEKFEYYIREDGTAGVYRYNGQDANVVIDAQYDGKPVTEIGQYAFEAARSVESVEIPSSVTKIGEFAFMDCDNLKKVTIPDGVTVLYRGTFAGCKALTEITIPAGVSETNEELFTGCGLTDLYVKNPSLTYNNWGLEDMEKKCTIHAPSGAAILTWAQGSGFPTAAE